MTDTSMVLLYLTAHMEKQLKEQPKRAGVTQPLCTHETGRPGMPSRTGSHSEEKLLRVESKLSRMRTKDTKKGNGPDKSGSREHCQEISEIKLGMLLKPCFFFFFFSPT